jgi:hypothetical protein
MDLVTKLQVSEQLNEMLKNLVENLDFQVFCYKGLLKAILPLIQEKDIKELIEGFLVKEEENQILRNAQALGNLNPEEMS